MKLIQTSWFKIEANNALYTDWKYKDSNYRFVEHNFLWYQMMFWNNNTYQEVGNSWNHNNYNVNIIDKFITILFAIRFHHNTKPNDTLASSKLRRPMSMANNETTIAIYQQWIASFIWFCCNCNCNLKTQMALTR